MCKKTRLTLGFIVSFLAGSCMAANNINGVRTHERRALIKEYETHSETGVAVVAKNKLAAELVAIEQGRSHD